ncbi:MAG: 23S rRNA (uracil(1939)-C(5))-methyltransferase RlmD [Thiohalomonadales bacterium]|nr:23S rRNA (uracil(1939)-C(5))-methyltransferase RlmD [Thiohalomonadales bacterium]
MSRRKKKLPTEPQAASIESLTHDGRGVARIADKTVFIDGALPGEDVLFRYTRARSNYDEGEVLEIKVASPHRVTPACEFFNSCGGCSLQHLDPAEQIRIKQGILVENLSRIGKVQAEALLPPLTGPIWGYRQKARLGVRYVHKKGRVLVGFREKHSAFLADMTHCKILNPLIGERLEDLSQLIRQLSCYKHIAQLEVAVGDEGVALIFRHLVDLTDADKQRLIEFGQNSEFQIYLQPGGPGSVILLWPERASLSYRLPAYDVTLAFQPNDFTQVNTAINQAMIGRALELLDPQATDQVLELFCGLGNFSLPLARQVHRVSAVEGDAALIERARQNAQHNGIDNVDYHVANLMENVSGSPWLRQRHYDKVLLDPPRSGALEMLPHLAALQAQRLVFVSCNPATLARDAGILVNDYGYRLVKAGVMDMFPHTAHVESIALFCKP